MYCSLAKEEPIWNAAVVIDSSGDALPACPRIGSTHSERIFFHTGSVRPTFSVAYLACAVLLCREVRDLEPIRPHVMGVRVLFWPGAIVWNSPRATRPENAVTRGIASAFSRTLGAYLVQCNWA